MHHSDRLKSRNEARLSQAPHRVQFRRVKGWRMPTNTVLVSRPGRFGNPFRIADWDVSSAVRDPTSDHLLDHEPTDPEELRGVVVHLHRVWLRMGTHRNRFGTGYFELSAFQKALLQRTPPPPTVGAIRDALAGTNLACHCRLDQACHADTLLAIANCPPQLGEHCIKLTLETVYGQTHGYRVG
ncbi:DUF4326 domain-containing protein [Amorphus sp. 3PC139-8]|uniref:DUF4326 domain-containing protein n=1 Tax=Amorphus sp. 3PC139-8 TaxID=2735676 RepID=UPI00345DF664